MYRLVYYYLSCSYTNLLRVSQKRDGSFRRLYRAFLYFLFTLQQLLAFVRHVIVKILIMPSGESPGGRTLQKCLVVYVVFQRKEWILRIAQIIMARHLFDSTFRHARDIVGDLLVEFISRRPFNLLSFDTCLMTSISMYIHIYITRCTNDSHNEVSDAKRTAHAFVTVRFNVQHAYIISRTC